MKLLSLQDYITQLWDNRARIERHDKEKFLLQSIVHYNDFLKQKLSLSIFTTQNVFKGITVQYDDAEVNFYKGIRVYNHYPEVHYSLWFSEVFRHELPTFNKTISDMTKYHIDLSEKTPSKFGFIYPSL